MVDRYSDFAIPLAATITDVVGLEGVGGAVGNVGGLMLGNAIGDS